MARCSASENFCCMKQAPEWRCWRWERPDSPSSTAIFRRGDGVRWWISALCAFSLLGGVSLHAAGPVDFGKSELDAAMAERKVKLRVDTELSLDPPETFRITLYKTGMVRITGGDLRGLMYGLIEAADQIRATGRLKAANGKPASAVRGVRMTLRSYDLSQPWFTADDRWRAYFQTLARSRLNRLTLTLPFQEADIERLRILSET